MNRSKTVFEFFRNKVRASIITLVLLFGATIPHAIRCQAGEITKCSALSKVAREWIQVGAEQYNRSLFKAAGQSFRRAAEYRKYLTGAEQKKLDKLSDKAGKAASAKEPSSAGVQTPDRSIRPSLDSKIRSLTDRSPPKAAPDKAKTLPDSVTEACRLSEKEWEFIAASPVPADNPLRTRGTIRIKPDRSLVAGKPKNAKITLAARPVYGHSVFVGGQVRKPMAVRMPGEMTAREAIIKAGGFDMRAIKHKSVIVIRYTDGRRYGYKLDIADKKTKPFYLQPRDIVHVPRTGIAKLNQWIDKHVGKLIGETELFVAGTSKNTAVFAGALR